MFGEVASFGSSAPTVITNRLCRPTKGRSLGATVSVLGRPIRKALAILHDQARPSSGATALYRLLRQRESLGAVSEPAALRIAWFLINAAILHAVNHGAERIAGIRDSAAWFFEGVPDFGIGEIEVFPDAAIVAADVALQGVRLDAAYLDILPYVLEPHGHITRGDLSYAEAVERRTRKRDNGVFYTPSDVVEFMVGAVWQGVQDATWLDPACGTAVFLRQVLRARKSEVDRLEFCKACIHGLDISPLATESAAFVLLAECADRHPLRGSPFAAWRAIARNIIPCDSTLIAGSPASMAPGLPTLADLFTDVHGGFDRIVMNPPYASFSLADSHVSQWASFGDTQPGMNGNAALAFVEMMWKFAKPTGAAAAVLPLSIAASTQRQYVGCRRAVSNVGGRWEFLFFDREPHALFGEDIKTRNAIVFRHGSEPSELYTSRMLKWTSSLRPTIFNRSRVTRLAAKDIDTFIPKLGSPAEVELYRRVLALRPSAKLPFELQRTTLREASQLDPDRAIVVGGTAYNFMNAFCPAGITDVQETAFSESPLHALLFDSSEARDVGLAVLASTLLFWMWHVEADGFHVTAKFIARTPLWQAGVSGEAFAELGRLAWEQAASTRVRSLNGGRVTYSFHCPFDSAYIKQIDHLLLQAINAPTGAYPALVEFVEQTTSIDGAKRRRSPT